jgi:hypothetical protein
LYFPLIYLTKEKLKIIQLHLATAVEKVSDHGTISVRRTFEFPEKIFRQERKQDNCKNLEEKY